ncbi:GSCFA domain-containing protein [Flavobacterium sp. CYK-55]|uniref:GSCFA domain-containing protein n=1 Tax=Flavobacterium sp. CYK-55 TaxID=2835529 RepID=UPI001BCBBBEE|nr:GSCFA domain-containing protein [Flavobacterium sp. CYK-55]MBS7785739.1 GSCFA domain-containing protein [Flavobacterium sp. CYK-55]
MQLHTIFSVKADAHPINYQSNLVLLGSCFAQNMGEKFSYFQFKASINPFGIIFNPISLKKIIERAVNNQMFTPADFFFHNERWQCFELHSELCHHQAEELLNELNLILKQFKTDLQNASHIVITLGTAWVYRHLTSQQIVANCHKVPQTAFHKELLSVEQIKQSLSEITELVRNLNPKVRFVFTISPVRHLKDGFVQNQQSKAHLISALHEFLATDANSSYFPAYEIMMDELRDYRFYADDLLHPNALAIEYIWQKWTVSHINSDCYATMNEVDSIRKAIAHKPFHPNSEGHQRFLSQLQIRIQNLQSQFDFISF